MIYLASPYYDKNEKVMTKRYWKVVHACAHLFKKGVLVYSPIAHWHPAAMVHDLPRTETSWQLINEHMIILSKGVWILTLPGWEASKGIARERAFASEAERPVKFVTFSSCTEA